MKGVKQEGATATSWAGDGAVQAQIDVTVKDGIERARRQLPCGCAWPVNSNAIGAAPLHASYNRRGSKDSQLR